MTDKKKRNNRRARTGGKAAVEQNSRQVVNVHIGDKKKRSKRQRQIIYTPSPMMPFISGFPASQTPATFNFHIPFQNPQGLMGMPSMAGTAPAPLSTVPASIPPASAVGTSKSYFSSNTQTDGDDTLELAPKNPLEVLPLSKVTPPTPVPRNPLLSSPEETNTEIVPSEVMKPNPFDDYPSNPISDEPLSYEQKLDKMFKGLDDGFFVKIKYLPADGTIVKRMSEMGFGASSSEAKKMLEKFKEKYPEKTMSHKKWQKSIKE